MGAPRLPPYLALEANPLPRRAAPRAASFVVPMRLKPDTFALTGAPGKPPRITAERGSVVTGTTLVFRSADSTIVVAGTEGGSKAAAGGRVHTETDLKQNH